MTNGELIEYVKTHRVSTETAFEVVGANAYLIKYVKPSHRLCLFAVMKNGLALKYVKRQTLDICKAAVRENGNALKYVRRQTPAICMAAVKSDKGGGLSALRYAKYQSYKLCLEAAKRNEFAARDMRELVKRRWIYANIKSAAQSGPSDKGKRPSGG